MKKKIYIQYNDEQIKVELDIENSLIQIRKKLSNIIKFPFIFENKENQEILKENEPKIKLKDILSGNSMFLKKEIKKREMLGKKIESNGRFNYYLYPEIDLSPVEKNLSLNILFFGLIGSGVSSLLQSFVNYLEGIQLEENNRYYLFDRKKYETWYNKKTYIIYNLKPTKIFNIPIRLIEIEGFSDSRQSGEFERLERDILKILTSEIDYIHALCYVIIADEIRINLGIIKIFEKLFSVLGNGIKNNFIILFTFANKLHFPALEIFNNKNHDIFKIFGNTNDLHYFQFDNSAYFGDDTKFVSKILEKSNESFDKLLKYIYTLNPITLEITKEIIQYRYNISNIIVNLCNEISDDIIKMNIIIKNRNSIKKLKDELYLIANNCYQKIKVIRQVKKYYCENYKEYINNGWLIFYCNSCNKICHNNCLGPNENLEEKQCKTIKVGKICSYCKCDSQKHEYKNYIQKIRNIEKIVDIETWINENKIIIDKNERKEKKEMIDIEIGKKENQINLLDDQIMIYINKIINNISLVIKTEKELKNSGIKINQKFKYSYFKKILNRIININNKTKNIFYKIIDDFESFDSNDNKEKNIYIKNIQRLLVN